VALGIPLNTLLLMSVFEVIMLAASSLPGVMVPHMMENPNPKCLRKVNQINTKTKYPYHVKGI
jgi:hypothetical protein